MKQLNVSPIGKVCSYNGEIAIKLVPEYIPGLTGLEGFGYIQVLWWFDKSDNHISRSKLIEEKPYKNGPELLGVFATRTPNRPNPIALTTAYVTHLDVEAGIINLAYIDAEEGSPVLDIKPYTPSLDRVNHIMVPEWCTHWPTCNEESGNFNWEKEFNF